MAGAGGGKEIAERRWEPCSLLQIATQNKIRTHSCRAGYISNQDLNPE